MKKNIIALFIILLVVNVFSDITSSQQTFYKEDEVPNINSYFFKDSFKNRIISGEVGKDKKIMPSYVSNEIIIKFKENPQIKKKDFIETKYPSINILNKKYNIKESKIVLTSTKMIDADKIYIFKIPSGRVEEAVEEYNTDSGVVYAQPNHLYYIALRPNDPSYPIQWAHQITQAEQGWDIGRGNYQGVIAIIDTGIDYTHEDLAPNMLGNCVSGCPQGTGFDFVDIDIDSYLNLRLESTFEEDYTIRDNNPSDYNGHGTHVAGIAAGRGNNRLGIAGVCWRCKIMPLRAGFTLYYQGQGIGLFEEDDILSAVYYAADNGARVISMSFGGGSPSRASEEAINYAYERGVIIIAAAGNSFSSEKEYPGAYENVIAVTATDESDNIAYFSNYGYWTDIAAPGINILSTVPKIGPLQSPSGYRRLSGTSMSTPYISGVAGLLISKDPSLTKEQIKSILYHSIDFPSESPEYIGTGRINVRKVLENDPRTIAYLAIVSPNTGDIITNNNLEVQGTADGDSYTVSYGEGNYPGSWTQISSGINTINGVLARWNIEEIISGFYTLRLQVQRGDRTFNDFKRIVIQKDVLNGWPQRSRFPRSITFFDINNDNYKEIIVGKIGGIDIYDYLGHLEKTFPIRNSFLLSSPAIDDLDNDGNFELVVGLSGGFGPNFEPFPGKIEIIDIQNNEVMTINPIIGDNYGFTSSPVLEDVDHDGNKEIIIGSNQGYIYIIRHDGRFLTNWPVKIPSGFDNAQRGVPLEHFIFNYPTAAVGDIDNDGDLEVITGAFDNSIHVFNIDGTYSNGWPKDVGGTSVQSPVIGDINRDNNLEIIVSEVSGTVYVFNGDGTPYQGWPRSDNDERFLFDSYSIALGDIGNNNKLEIAVGLDYGFYLFDDMGRIFDGFPTNIGDLLYGPIIGNFNSDNTKEILASGKNGILYMINNQGRTIWRGITGSPYLMSPPAVGDINNDGYLEVGVVGREEVYIWTLNAIYNKHTLEWPMFQHDPQHTGLYSEYSEPFLRGDPDQDGRVTLNDAIFITNFLFNAGESPYCIDSADVNDDGSIDLSDAIYLLLHLFQGRTAPPEPYPAAGVDPTVDNLPACGETF